MNIAFFVRHFTERGTEVAIYDYAHYNQTILDNNSIIICFTPEAQQRIGWPNIRESYEKFKSRFLVLEINDISDMKQLISDYSIDIFYTMTHGGPDIYQFENKDIWNQCKTIKHCVFNTRCLDADYNWTIGQCLNENNNTNIPLLPHMVNLANCDEDLRDELHIPQDAVVIGRYGGVDQFDIQFVHDAIKAFLETNTNTYFLFMNTNKFYEHPNILYLDGTTNMIYKTKFINTCDAMIHARMMGETFGLTIAEFSSRNKPVITCICGDIEHIKILKHKAIFYNSKDQLVNIFKNIKDIAQSRTDWNAYREYSPENIMKIFHSLITPNKMIQDGILTSS